MAGRSAGLEPLAGGRAPHRARTAVDGPAGELAFREELHAYEALLAGQGIAIYSDLLARRALEGGQLVKAFDLPLPGPGF